MATVAIIEKRFNYKGFPCVILMQGLGYRTGYVGISKNANKPYLTRTIKCHGGLSYSSDKLFGQQDKDIWWLGFDCNHYGDMPDYQSAFRLFKHNTEILTHLKINSELNSDMKSYSTPRSLCFCEDECKNIVNQIINMNER